MPTYKLPKYQPIPEAALRLNEDILSLQAVQKLLSSVDCSNVADDRNAGYRQLRIAQAAVQAMYSYAWDKMRQEFLAPGKKKIERGCKSTV